MTHRNILLITTDQQSSTMLSCTGNPDLNTPNLDLLAKNGMRFDKAYVAQPLCIPQRSSWYTGLMPHEHGVTFNIAKDQIQAKTMMGQIFRDSGYATGYSGKWHVNTPVENKQTHGFDWINNTICNGADKNIVNDFSNFLDQKGEQPFLFSASFNNPHNICEAARGGPFPDGEPGMIENLNELPALPDNFEIPEREPSVIREVQYMYRENNYPTQNWDETRWRLHRWYYCRLTEIIDKRIGQLLEVLKKTGHSEDTTIVFTSDHGDGNAHHHWNQKQVLYDESAKVPFIISQVDKNLNTIDDHQLINTGIDLIPTLCGLAEIETPSVLQGLDWSKAYNDVDLTPQRDYVVVETEFGTFGKRSGYLGRAIRTQNFKYMVYSSGQNHEFFVNMNDDPGEMNNLVGDPNYENELKRHRKILSDYIVESNDIFPLEMIPVLS